MEARLVNLMSGGVGLVLCAGLTTLTGCATAGSATHASTASASAPSGPATLTTSSASAPSSTTTTPTLGPQSIAIVGRSAVGSDIVLRVTAPAETRFRVGTSMELAVPCPATVEKPGDPTAYRVVCPASPHGSQLVATITLGDFDYTFTKPL